MWRLVLCLLLALGSCVSSEAEAARYGLVIVTSEPPSPAGSRVVSWFDQDEKLKTLKEKLDFNVLTTSSVLYRERYATSLPSSSLPVVCLYSPNGAVIYKVSGPAVPDSADALRTAIATAGKAYEAAGGGLERNDCPTCPTPPLRRPVLDSVLDRAIPDVNLSPSIEINNGVLIAVGIITVAVVVICFIGFVVLVVVPLFIFLIRR